MCTGLSDTDKRHAIVLALQAWPDKSGREIAEQMGVNQNYVSEVRRQVSGSTHLPTLVTGKDGKRYPATRPKARPVVPPTSEKSRADAGRLILPRRVRGAVHPRAPPAPKYTPIAPPAPDADRSRRPSAPVSA